jgi:hypothetical protein
VLASVYEVGSSVIDVCLYGMHMCMYVYLYVCLYICRLSKGFQQNVREIGVWLNHTLQYLRNIVVRMCVDPWIAPVTCVLSTVLSIC